jgi:hypothetical protein
MAMQLRTQADLEALIGEPETEHLEFKSSVPLVEGPDKNSIRKFLAGKIAEAVSGFLNSSGGNIIIGIDEDKNGVAARISPGVNEEIINAHRMQQIIVDMIQPSVADLVSVNAIKLEKSNVNGERLNAFCVSVRGGVTAYQAPDKIYYARRAGQTVPMDDKDVRIRMLAGDKPRIDVGLTTSLHSPHGFAAMVSSVQWDIDIRNVGLRTINRAFIRYKIVHSGFGASGTSIADTRSAAFLTDLRCEGSGEVGLMPGMNMTVRSFDVPSLMFGDASDEVSLEAEVQVFIDDGLPFATRINLMEVLGPLIAANWKRA